MSIDSNDMIVESDIMVKVRDGIHLATDVYRPASQPGPFPVIFERTPYGKTEAIISFQVHILLQPGHQSMSLLVMLHQSIIQWFAGLLQ